MDDHGTERYARAIRPGPFDPARLPAYLLGRGLLDARRVVDGDLSIVEASRRNHNLHVGFADQTGIVLKQGAARGDGPGTVAYEALVYSTLDDPSWGGLLTGRIPRCFGFDRELNCLTVELVPGAENLRERQQRRGAVDTRLAHAMGDTLGRLHRPGAVATGMSNQLPEVFAMTLPRFRMLHGTSTGMLEMITALQNLGGLGAGLRELGQDWRRAAVIHGDPRWDNWVVLDAPPGSDARSCPLVLVDWEFASLGEPGWDVGSALGDYLATWVMSTPELPGARLDSGLSLSRFRIESLQPAMAALWEGYLAERRPDHPAAELTMAARCAAAKLIQMSGEQMHHATELTATAGALLQLAGHIFAEPDRAASVLMGIATPVGGAV